MKNDSEDIVYRCKDCDKYSLCEYYHGRKEKSQICHYFELPERKTGKWTKDIYGNVVCSECRANRRDNRIGHITFCNCCGAKMEEADGDT